MLPTLNITEPLYWRITDSIKVNAMLNDLEQLILKKISKEQFLITHTPNNAIVVHHEVQDYSNIDFDFEGFVFFTDVNDKSISALTNTLATCEYNYNKIKTTMYYKAHNFKFKNIEYLINMADLCGDIFPLSKKVKEFFNCTPEKLISSLTDIKIELFKPTTDDQNILFNNLQEKAKKTFSTKSLDTQIKILINGSDVFGKLSYDIFIKYFIDLTKSENTQEVMKTIKSIVMKLEIWKDLDLNKVVENYLKDIKTNIELQELLFYCINS